MTKSELIARVLYLNPGISAYQAERSVELIFDEIGKTLSKGGRVELRGFGIFTTRKREARLGRNPRTGDVVRVEGKTVPFFKAGKELTERMNSN